ncbi:MAG: calcium-binding protein, partial [Patescibacteria group bacterium]
MKYIMCLVVGVLLSGLTGMASDSVCASVNIEVNQELTLESEGFDAHMRINNGLENIALNNVGITVKFTDADGQPVIATSEQGNTNAQFYIAVDSMSGISGGVSGEGAISPLTSADIHWLIIPIPGAGGDKPQGVMYYVGATLSYRIGESSNVTEVVPDYIYVKPMPNLALDYFLPVQVYGDDAFTDGVEPSVPFVLGLRVKNIGYGVAWDFKLDSSQPQIMANANGLLVGFELQQCEVNGVACVNSLLVDLGNIAPSASASANWIMTCSLSGIFTNFMASFSHSDELGGQLTSLIQPENLKTHRLIHDVLVDLSNRDGIRDYLADDGEVYESEGIDSVVTNLSTGAQLSQNGANYVLILPGPEEGFIYVALANPVGTNMALESVVRSDGKTIKAANAWISKQRKPNPSDGWDYSFNLFDANPSN